MLSSRRLLARCKLRHANDFNKRPIQTSSRTLKEGPFGFGLHTRIANDSAVASSIAGAPKPMGTKAPPPRAFAPEKASSELEEDMDPELSPEDAIKKSLLSSEHGDGAITSETGEETDAQTSSNFASSNSHSNRLMLTSHMTGIIQRIAYHLLFRPTGAKAIGTPPIQIATLAPTHGINSIACVVQSVLSTYNPDQIIHSDTAPLRNVCIIVPTESYKFQAMELLRITQLRGHRSWTLLTEDEFMSSLFPGYSNSMTPYIDSIGCVVLPHGAAAQKFVETALRSERSGSQQARKPSDSDEGTQGSSASSHKGPLKARESSNSYGLTATHFTQRWTQTLDQNAHSQHKMCSQLSPGHSYGRYSARELTWAMIRPDNDFDTRMQLPRLQHAVQALKSSRLTDVIAFNTSSDMLSLLSTLHGLVGEFSGDSTLPDFLAPFHPETPADANFKRPKRQDSMPNMSFALDFLSYSNVSIPYLALKNPPSAAPPAKENTEVASETGIASFLPDSVLFKATPPSFEFEERILDHSMKTGGPGSKSASFGFWESSRGNTFLTRRAIQTDPMPSLLPTVKSAFAQSVEKDRIRTDLDSLFSVNSHLELTREALPEAIPLLLSAASHALSARDTPAIPLRILCQHNMDLVSISNMLEMQGIPTVSQNLFATPPVRMLCDLFTILIELSKQSVLDRAKKIEKEEAQKKRAKEDSVAEDSNATSSDSSTADKQDNRPRKKDSSPKSELHWIEAETGQVNLAAAFHSLLHGAYGFDNSQTRHVESRMMYQFIKYQDPIMSLLLGIATDAKYTTLNPQEARKKAYRASADSLLAKERAAMMKAEVEKSIELATEDADLMISLLKSPDTPFRTKALASEVLRLQQAWAKQESQGLANKTDTELENSGQDSSQQPSIASGSDVSPTDGSESTSVSGSTESLPEGSTSKADEDRPDSKSPKKRTSKSKRYGSDSHSDRDPNSGFYNAKNDRATIAGAKHFYQDLAYLIGAIRAMPLSPSEIIDLYTARHASRVAEEQLKHHRLKDDPARAQLDPNDLTKKTGASKHAILNEEVLTLMKAFSTALKGLNHSPSSTASSKSTDADVLTEHYLENAQHMQKALEFVKHAYVETPAASFVLASRRARSTSMRNHADRAPFFHPVVLSLDNFADHSGDFVISLRTYSDPQLNTPQPALLPPPATFTAQAPKGSPGVNVRANPNQARPVGFVYSDDPETLMKQEWDASKLRRLFSSTLLYSFTSSRFPYPYGDAFMAPHREVLTLQSLTSKLGTAFSTPRVRSLYFDTHPVNNPSEAELDAFFHLPEGVKPTNPSVGSIQQNAIPASLSPLQKVNSSQSRRFASKNRAPQRQIDKKGVKLVTSTTTNGLFPEGLPGSHSSSNAPKSPDSNSSALLDASHRIVPSLGTTVPAPRKIVLDYSNPAMDIPRDSLHTPLMTSGPSFLLYGAFHPYNIGSSSVRVYRDCQVLFAFRYIWFVEPGKPASIYATTGMALHEAASKVHSQMLEKLAQVLKHKPVLAEETPAIVSEEALTTAEGAPLSDEEATQAAEESSASIAESEAATTLEVTAEETQLVHDTMIEGAFKTSIMQAQGLTEEEADLLLSQPEYRRHIERAKKQTLFQWEKEKIKQLEMATKLKAKKEKLRAEKLEKRQAAAAEKAKKKLESPEKDVVQETEGEKADEKRRAQIIAGETVGPVSEDLVIITDVEKKAEQVTVAVGVELLDGKEVVAPEVIVAAEKPPTPEKVTTVEEPEDESELELDESDQLLVEPAQYSFSEQEFAFQLPSGHTWKGAWDRVDIDPETGAVEITEYKTSVRKNRDSGLFQLQTYALAYWKLHHVVPSKLVLSSLSTAHSEEYLPTKLDLIRTENLILATLQRMADGLFAPTNKPAQCFTCSYSLQCPSALTASPLYLAPPKAPRSTYSTNNVIDTSKVEHSTKENQDARPKETDENRTHQNSDRHDSKKAWNEKRKQSKYPWQRNSKAGSAPRFHIQPKSSKESPL